MVATPRHLDPAVQELKVKAVHNDTVETVVEADCKRLRIQPAPFTGHLPRDNAITAAH